MLTHLYCLAVRHATVNRNLRDCQSSSSSSSSCSSSTRCTACAITTNTAVGAAAVAATTGTRTSGRSSSSCLGCSAHNIGYGVGSAWKGGGRVDRTPSSISWCSSGLWCTLHCALCSSHL